MECNKNFERRHLTRGMNNVRSIFAGPGLHDISAPHTASTPVKLTTLTHIMDIYIFRKKRSATGYAQEST